MSNSVRGAICTYAFWAHRSVDYPTPIRGMQCANHPRRTSSVGSGLDTVYTACAICILKGCKIECGGGGGGGGVLTEC